MTGPTRKLPPLLVEITADPSKALDAYKKVVSGAGKMAKEVQSSLADMSKSMTTELGKTAAKQVKATKESFNSLPAYLRGVVSPATKAVTEGINKGISKQQAKFRKNLKQHTTNTLKENRKEVQRFLNLGSGSGKEAFKLTSFGMQVKKGVLQSNQAAKNSGFDLTDLVANAERRKLQRRTEIQRRNKQLDLAAKKQRDAEDKANTKATQARAKSTALANAKLAKSVEDGAKIQQDQMQARVSYQNHINDTIAKMRDFAAKLKKEDAEETQRATNKRIAIRQASRLERATREFEDQKALAAEQQRTLRRSRVRERDRLRELKKQRESMRSRLSSSMSGAGGNMMGARADIFMHTGALQNMTSMAASFLTPFAQVENSTIQMEAYAGSAEAAKAAVEELQRFAIDSPYKLEGVLEAASHLMKYGQTAENAIDITKMLGDVAGGNTAKLELLALATAQATGFGKLQGQELRQLVNAGFNPLQTAAEQLAGGKGSDPALVKAEMAKLLKVMRAGGLSSDIIQAALEVETSKGGKFAGITEKQSKSLMGWANQFLETLDLIKIQVTEAFAPELKAAMKTVVDFTQATVDWMKANKQLVRDYVMFGLQLLKVVVGFHLLAAGLAYTKWIVGTLSIMIGGLTTAFGWLKLAVDAMALSSNKNVAGWGNWLKSTGNVVVRIAGIAGMLIALALLLEGLFSKDGFSGMFKRLGDLFRNTLGFLYNIGYNITGIFDFIGKNWDVMLVGMLTSTLNIVNSMFMIFAKLISFIPGAGDISNAMYSAIPDLQKQITELLIGDKTLDTSMFKFDGPSMSDIPGLDAAKKALEPFMPKDKEKLLKDAPGTDFNQFLGAGSSKSGQMRDHAISGSAEHAMRMYQFGQQARGDFDAAKKSHEKKQEDLLTKIEKNTRPQGQGMGGTLIEEAMLA